MDFIDLHAQQIRIRASLEARIKKVLDHGMYILGPEIQELEESLSRFCGAPHAVSCSNGTDALLIPLMALGIGPGDAVFVPTFTFFATAEVVTLAGATPVFVDIDPRTYNICPRSLEEKINHTLQGNLTPRAIIPVDLFGIPAPYEQINLIAAKYSLAVIEDAAQSFGASYHGKRAGNLAPIAATSFFPAKPLGCYGDGGAIFCSDPELNTIIRSIRVHGQGKDKYENVRMGLNGRLDTIQAAILLEKLAIFEDEIERRNRVAERYTAALKGRVVTPEVPKGSRSVWAQYTIQVNDRKGLMAALKERSIPTMIYYPCPLHLQPAYRALEVPEGSCPVAERLAHQVISLPMHPYLSERDQEQVIDAILEFV